MAVGMKKFLIPALILILTLVALPIWSVGQQESGIPFEERYQDMSWDEIVAEAVGQTVYFYMWGGSDVINNWVSGFYGDKLKTKYGITLEMVPITGPQVYINKVLSEKQAGRNKGSAVDLIWINGENFRTMRQADLLFGPYSQILPNMEYLDASDPAFLYDFGYPVEGYESPYGAAQMVMIYDSAKTPTPPSTVGELIDWIKGNPGKFTYSAPPDFNGSAFVRHFFYHVAGGADAVMGDFNQTEFDEIAGKFYKLMNELEPYLWREGTTYPEDVTKWNELFANGEVLFTANYGPGDAAAKIKTGKYPESVRTFVFDEGTIGNINYLAIP